MIFIPVTFVAFVASVASVTMYVYEAFSKPSCFEIYSCGFRS